MYSLFSRHRNSISNVTKNAGKALAGLALGLVGMSGGLVIATERAEAAVQCVGVPYTHIGGGGETWNFYLDSRTCGNEASGFLVSPTNGFSMSTTQRRINITGVNGSVGSDFSSCVSTTNNTSNIQLLDEDNSNTCDVGGFPRYFAADNDTYNFTFNMIGKSDGITYTISITTTATAVGGSQGHTISAMSVSGGGFGVSSLVSQQKAISGLTMSGQMNNMATGVSDYLDGRLDDVGGDLQVTANGFSASTTGFANILNSYQAKQNNPLASLNGDVTTSGYSTPQWNAWLKGNWNIYDGTNFDGHTIDVMAGLDYRYSDTTIIGLLGGYGVSDFDVVTSGIDGSFKGDSYSFGPYIGMKLSEHLKFKALAAYTFSDYANVSGTTDGNFDAHRATVMAELTGTWNYDAFFVSPGIRFVYAQENQDGYTDSAGTTHSSLVIRAGRISVGPKIGYTHKYENGGSFRPWLALNGEYDFSNQDADAGSGMPDLSDVLSARFKAGFDATTSTGISLSLQGNVSGIGSDQFTGYGGTAKLRVPF